MEPNAPGLQLNVKFFTLLILAISLSVNSVNAQSPNKETKPRIIITADPELDDNNSLIRFLLYSCDVDVEGLIYASSGYHWKGDGKGTKWYVPGREYARFRIGYLSLYQLALGKARTIY